MLTYYLDIEEQSSWLRTTPGQAALSLPFYATEAGLFYGRKHFSTMRTDKNSYILFYTLSGAGMLEQGNQQLFLTEGTAVLMDCRMPQSYCTAPGHSHWHHYWVHLDGVGVGAMAALLNPQGLRLLLPNQTTVSDCFLYVLAHLQAEGVDEAVQMSLRLQTLLCALHAAGEQDAVAVDNSHRSAVQHTADYLRAHCAEKINLDDLHSRVHLSKYYFIRLFKQYMGTTPYNYLLCHRITKAKDLLCTTTLPVQEIARQVGFTDDSNFSVQFRRLAGQSPISYRRNALPPR